MKSFVRLAQFVHVALRRPRLARQPLGRLGHAGDEVDLAAVAARVVDDDVPVDAPPFRARRRRRPCRPSARTETSRDTRSRPCESAHRARAMMSRTIECTPSAPITRSASARRPSSNLSVTRLAPFVEADQLPAADGRSRRAGPRASASCRSPRCMHRYGAPNSALRHRQLAASPRRVSHCAIQMRIRRRTRSRSALLDADAAAAPSSSSASSGCRRRCARSARLLVHVDVEAGQTQRRRGGQPAHPGADDGNGEGHGAILLRRSVRFRSGRVRSRPSSQCDRGFGSVRSRLQTGRSRLQVGAILILDRCDCSRTNRTFRTDPVPRDRTDPRKLDRTGLHEKDCTNPVPHDSHTSP